MKNFIQPLLKKNSPLRIVYCVLFFLIFLSPGSDTILAQTDSALISNNNSSAVIQSDSEGPSLDNMKKTGGAMTEEVKKMKERQAREEFIGYVIMVLGFGFVVFLAWFLTVQARKMQEKKDEEKRKYLEAKIANQSKSSAHKNRRR